ncbi:MAG TPA: glycine--tRNA ligase subunit beta [Luteimonas sp.]|jgi:glycyl-tRNA synthetase beta chain|nr:glycine--tRNA ligase subunit beta [Luteimonas sp.]
MSDAAAMKPLLVEIGTEELPVGALPGLAQALFDGAIDGLAKRGIAFERGEAKPLYTPRRLAVLLPGVAAEQPEQHSEVLGPYVNIALDADGRPTKALEGFAAKAGVHWSALARTSDARGERFVHRATRAGAATVALLPEIVREAVAAMPIPKPMRWGARSEGFARPVHWFVLLLGDEVVDGELFGLRAGRVSRGHRFMSASHVSIGAPGEYVDTLRSARVLVDPAERRERVVREVEVAAESAGGVARIDAANLAQVECLVEWPSAILCGFERGFLAVPQEALVATMEANQKFFPVLDDAGRLTEHFVGVANIASKDPSEVRKGYERVIRPRFADARFFFDEDLEQGLASMNEGLGTVTYQAKLGSVADKVARVVALAEAVARAAGVDVALARRAAELSKADLQSRLVNEFPELQGIAGRYYARAAGEPADVADAIDEAYRPRFAGDDIALSPVGKVLAIAERLDTLAGGFAAGLKPTGNKDPFALRRNALALARTIIESGLHISLYYGLLQARKLQPIATADEDALALSTHELTDFVYERLRSYYAEKGVPQAHFEAVRAVETAANGEPDNLADFDRRIGAIGEFATLPEAEALAAANKRIRNILRKADGAIPSSVDRALLREPAESALAEAVEAACGDTDAALARGDYVAVLGRLARLRPQVDAFFDQVMVNVDDPAVRGNRLALLQRLADRLGSVAAIEHLSA